MFLTVKKYSLHINFHINEYYIFFIYVHTLKIIIIMYIYVNIFMCNIINIIDELLILFYFILFYFILFYFFYFIYIYIN